MSCCLVNVWNKSWPITAWTDSTVQTREMWAQRGLICLPINPTRTNLQYLSTQRPTKLFYPNKTARGLRRTVYPLLTRIQRINASSNKEVSVAPSHHPMRLWDGATVCRHCDCKHCNLFFYSFWNEGIVMTCFWQDSEQPSLRVFGHQLTKMTTWSHCESKFICNRNNHNNNDKMKFIPNGNSRCDILFIYLFITRATDKGKLH